MIPLFIPYLNRPDLLETAVKSADLQGCEVIVLNNSGKPLNYFHNMMAPVPLSFAQTHNWMLQLLRDEPFYLWMHSDAEAVGDTVLELGKLAEKLTAEGRKWGVIWTAYDALSAINTAAAKEVGPWDTTLEWYHCDNDYYRRMKLAGYECIDSNLPVNHTPSRTINSDREIAYRQAMMQPFRESFYRAKWGGLPPNEVYQRPFNGEFD